MDTYRCARVGGHWGGSLKETTCRVAQQRQQFELEQ
jgi:hypothetical protein